MRDLGRIFFYGTVFSTLIALGVVSLVYGFLSPFGEWYIALGAAFIIPGFVGLYMMAMSNRIAKGLHERFNEQNKILNEQSTILNEQSTILNEQSTILNDIASSQRDIVHILKRIEGKL